MSPPRVIRPAARRTPAGARSLLWTAAAAALPVIVIVLVLVAVTLAVLVFSARGFDSLFAVVAVEWLVVNRVPLTVDELSLGFLPLLPPLIYVAVLARQTRAVLSDIELPGPREAGAAVAGVTVAGTLLTVLAALLVGSAASDFAVRPASLPTALVWTAAVALCGSGLGVWLYFRRELREVLPLWVRGGIHLGSAFVAAVWAIATVLVLIGLVAAWSPVGSVLEIGKDVVGTAALTAISVAYLPNVVMAAATLAVGGEAHLGEASFSVFAVSRGPMPEVPLAAALPTTDPHWAVQGLLLVTVLVAAGLSRAVAHWFRTTADAVRAAWLAAAIVALVVTVSPVVAGGDLGVLGTVGTGSLIAAGTALALFGVIGSATIALSLAGLTRRRERAESELERRRRRSGVAPEVVETTEAAPGVGEAPDVPDEEEAGSLDRAEPGEDPARDGGMVDDDEVRPPAPGPTDSPTESAESDSAAAEGGAEDGAESGAEGGGAGSAGVVMDERPDPAPQQGPEDGTAEDTAEGHAESASADPAEAAEDPAEAPAEDPGGHPKGSD